MRILAIDYGLKHIGLAITDPTGTIAQSYKTLENKKGFLNAIKEICKNEEVGKIVVGMPVGFKGDTEQTKKTRDFITALEFVVGIPIFEENEIFTSKIASERVIKGQNIHQQAAVVILESFIESNNK